MDSIKAKPYQTITDLCMSATGGLSYLPTFCQINDCNPEDDAEVGRLYYYDYVEDANVANLFFSEQPSSIEPSGGSVAPLPVERLYSAGNGVEIIDNIIQTKIDGDTIKFSVDGAIYCDATAIEQSIINKAVNRVLTDVLPSTINQVLQRVSQELLPSTLQSAKDYADEQDATILQSAKSYADEQDATTLQSAKDYAVTKNATTLQSAKDYANNRVQSVTSSLGQYQKNIAFVNLNYVSTPNYGQVYTALSSSILGSSYFFFGKWKDTQRIFSISYVGQAYQGEPAHFVIKYLSSTTQTSVSVHAGDTTAVASNFNLLIGYWH